MPKIKEFNSNELQEYLWAYKNASEIKPDDEEIEFTLRAIEKALKDREILGLENGTNMTRKFINLIKTKFKNKE